MYIYGTDFLLAEKNKISPVEVKFSVYKSHLIETKKKCINKMAEKRQKVGS